MVSSLFDDDPIATSIPLTSREKALKERLEAIVERGIGQFLEVGLALGELRSKRLYRTTNATFELYVRDRFGLARSTVDGVIRSATTAKSLIDSGLEVPPSVGEATLRPIASLPGNDLQAATWEFVSCIAPACGATQPLVARICRVIRNSLDLEGGERRAAYNSRRRESPQRELPFLRPVERLAAWHGFSVEIIVSTVAPPSAHTVWQACATLADRCRQVQQRLESLYPELVQ
jgi:hypothetical protein